MGYLSVESSQDAIKHKIGIGDCPSVEIELMTCKGKQAWNEMGITIQGMQNKAHRLDSEEYLIMNFSWINWNADFIATPTLPAGTTNWVKRL